MGRPRRATAEPVSYAENTKDSFLASALNHNSKGMGQYLSSTSMSTTIPTQRKRVRKDSIVDSAEANKENVIKKADKPDSKSKAKKGKDTKLIKSQAGVKNPNKPVGLSKRPRIEKPPISKEVVSSVKPNIKKGLVDTVVTARSDPSVVWGKYQELIRLRSTDAEENCQLLRARIEELRQSHRREIKNLTEEIEQAKKGQARSDSVAKSEANLDATSKTEIKKLRLQLAEAQKSSLALKLELNVAQKEQKQVAVTTKSDHKDTVKLHKAIKRKNEELDDISQQIQLIATERDELHSELLAMKATNKSLSAKLKKASGSQSQDLISALEKNADVMETLRNHEDLIQTYADLTGIAISQIPGSQRKLDCSLIQKDGQELAFTLTWSEDDSEIEYTPYDSNSYGANIQDYLQEIFVFKIEMLRKFFLTLSKCC